MKKSNPLWGILLIIIGLFWVLGSSDLVRFDIWGSLGALYPLIIIALGATLFIPKEAHGIRTAVWTAVILIIGGCGIYMGYQNVALEDGSYTFDMTNEVRNASLEVNLGSADFRLVSTSSSLAKVESNIEGLQTIATEGNNSVIRISQNNKIFGAQAGKRFSVALNDSVPWEIELNTGTAEGILDYSDVILEKCEINTGTCDLRIIAGDRQEESRVVVNGGVVDISLSVPSGMGIMVQNSTAVSGVHASGIKMNKDSRNYYSEGYDDAKTRVILEINSGGCNIDIKVR
jgi:hypothetical protein